MALNLEATKTDPVHDTSANRY